MYYWCKVVNLGFLGSGSALQKYMFDIFFKAMRNYAKEKEEEKPCFG